MCLCRNANMYPEPFGWNCTDSFFSRSYLAQKGNEHTIRIDRNEWRKWENVCVFACGTFSSS